MRRSKGAGPPLRIRLPTVEHEHAIGHALARKMDESTVEGRQPAAATDRKGQQVRGGHLRGVSKALPGDVLVAGDLDVVGPEDVAGEGGDTPQDFPRFPR